jgi:hypothetical protein
MLKKESKFEECEKKRFIRYYNKKIEEKKIPLGRT